MRQNTGEISFAFDRTGNFNKIIRVGLNTGAMAVAVDFNQHRARNFLLIAVLTEHNGRLDIIENNLYIAARTSERKHAIKFPKADADRVNEIINAVREKILCFSKRGNSGRT